MRALLAILPFLVVASCGHRAAKVGGYHPMQSADGTTWYSIECGSAYARCLATAVSLCPQGYDTSPRQSTNDDGEVTSFMMLVRCRTAAAPSTASPLAATSATPAATVASKPPAPDASAPAADPSRFRPYDRP